MNVRPPKIMRTFIQLRKPRDENPVLDGKGQPGNAKRNE
jgi:hypothetical protein